MKKFECAVLNPPFDGNLHLKINNNVLGLMAPDGVMCAIHPGRWLLDPLAEYKSATDRRRFPDLISNLISAEIYGIDGANEFFGIENCTDMAVTLYSGTATGRRYDPYTTPLYRRCFDKIMRWVRRPGRDLLSHCERRRHSGWRVEIKDIRFPVFDRDRASQSFIVCGAEAFRDGYRITVPLSADSPSVGWWSETVGKSQHLRSYPDEIPISVRFDTKEEALGFRDACRSRFMVNWCYMIKTDMHTPLAFIPWLGDYGKAWDGDALCSLFGLDGEESAYMLRDVDNYVVKDFIAYKKV